MCQRAASPRRSRSKTARTRCWRSCRPRGGWPDLRLATEAKLKYLLKDCEPGAVPPLGAAYGLETVWDDSLLEQSDTYFEAGDHETLVHMKRAISSA
jgi:prolyl-tRNA editing enzyme YbaK/EbsC (Cys-tRNA(Pro) deacylase)